jgi:hypothetical protein
MTHTFPSTMAHRLLAGLIAFAALAAARADVPAPVLLSQPFAAATPAARPRPADGPFGPGLLDALGPPPASPATPPTFIETARRTLIGEGIDVDDGCTPGDGVLPATRPPGSTWSNGVPLLLFDWSGRSPDPWAAAGLRSDGDKRTAKAGVGLGRGDLSSNVTVRGPDGAPLDPPRSRTWETNETVKVPVAGPLFLYGNLGASSPSVEQQHLRWRTKTGVGVRLRPWVLDEVQVRGGSAVRYDDTDGTRGGAEERSELFLEVTTKLPLPVLGPVNVEYSGVAVPAPTPAERDRVNQDFKLAKPLGGGNEFHLGARYQSEDVPAPAPWVDRMQLYMGLQLKR